MLLHMWTIVDNCGQLWTIVDNCGQLWTCENDLEVILLLWDTTAIGDSHLINRIYWRFFTQGPAARPLSAIGY